MSFSLEVKKEIENHLSTSRHCQIAEMAAYVVNFGRWTSDFSCLIWQSDKEMVLRKVFTLLRKTYNIYSVVEETEDSFRIVLKRQEEVRKVLQSIHFEEVQEKTISPLIIKNTCCRRAFLRGSFLCIGSISDPEKSYHLELVCSEELQAVQIKEILKAFDLEAKITERKKHHVVYMKDGESIVEVLNIMGAHKALMNLENLRIVKEVRNNVNRKVNCETANISKTVNAASRQIEDITFLKEHYGFQNLPDNLREMAQVRLEHADVPLKELGEYLDPPVGKSGVNHRLRKISELAESLRG